MRMQPAGRRVAYLKGSSLSPEKRIFNKNQPVGLTTGKTAGGYLPEIDCIIKQAESGKNVQLFRREPKERIGCRRRNRNDSGSGKTHRAFERKGRWRTVACRNKFYDPLINCYHGKIQTIQRHDRRCFYAF